MFSSDAQEAVVYVNGKQWSLWDCTSILHDFSDITSSFESWSCTWICGAVTDTTHNLAQVGMKTEDHDTYFCDGSGSYILLQYEKIWITD